jgi:hypothetical protein
VKRTPLKRGVQLRRRARINKRGRLAQAKKELDALCREVTFLRDTHCVWPGCTKTENTQWCHIVTRRVISLRHRMENVCRMCPGHHLRWHHHPLEGATWFREKYPDRADFLHLAAQHPHRFDPEATRIYLEQERDYWSKNRLETA